MLWTAVVGSPSAGRSPALDPVLTILRQLESEAIEAGRQARLDHEEAQKIAQVNAELWDDQVAKALKEGRQPPPRPSSAIEPAPLPLPRMVVGDTTPERLGGLLENNPKGLLQYRDEMSGWLGSFGRYSSNAGGERAFWLETFGGRP